jgi:transcriptional regulator with XRE-family HTH domain
MASAERDFARGLRILRTAENLSQTALSRLLVSRGVTVDPSAVSRMESVDAPRALRLNEAAAIASIFGRSIEQVCSIGDEAGAQVLAAELRRLADSIDGGTTSPAEVPHA